MSEHLPPLDALSEDFQAHLQEQLTRYQPSQAFQDSLDVRFEGHSAELEASPTISDIPLMRGLAFWIFGRLGLDQELASDLILAYEEALANVVRHAYADTETGWSLTRIAREGDQLHIELRDRGEGGKDPKLAERLASITKEGRPPLQHRGGLGLYLMRRLMDELQYTAGGEENCLRMQKTLESTLTQHV